MTNEQIRCAIYTRKSSEEGLDQSFNSLEAQREACIAYINSQKHEGWLLVNDHYDDGGYSGGSMERPALKRLLGDISAGRVKTVVVYKVDRLTRSLADFAKIIEVFDSHEASFISITQHFNTTTSMGRLTLNVLLSFAQFERELTGERIRDKIAASKKKGMWMGGTVPLGYDRSDHRLIVNQAEAKTVNEIFKQYLKLGCVEELKNYLARERICSKVRSSSAGKSYGGAMFSRGALYHLLSNRVYLGKTVHQGQCYPGLHDAIVPLNLWEQVAARLEANNQGRRTRKSVSTPSLLSGIVFDTKGVRFTPTHAVKKRKRYRYYSSQSVIRQAGIRPTVTRFPAQGLETLVTSQILCLLRSPDKCFAGLANSPEKDVAAERANDLAKRWPQLNISKQYEFVRKVVRRVTVGQTTVWIEVDQTKLAETLLGHKPELVAAIDRRAGGIIKLNTDFEPVRQGSELRLIAPSGSCFDASPVPSLVKAVVRARDWYERIVAGEVSTIKTLCQRTGLGRTYVKAILRCAVLSPQITEMILSGKHRPDLTLQKLRSMPIDWQQQQDKIFQLPQTAKARA